MKIAVAILFIIGVMLGVSGVGLGYFYIQTSQNSCEDEEFLVERGYEDTSTCRERQAESAYFLVPCLVFISLLFLGVAFWLNRASVSAAPTL